MADTNVVVITGRIVRDPELKTNQTGMSYCQFAVANSRKKDEVTYFNFTAFGKVAEIVSSYAKKGRYVNVTGSVDQRNYTNNEGKSVSTYSFVANSVDLVALGRESQQNAAPAAPVQNPTPAPQPVASEANEDLPF